MSVFTSTLIPPRQSRFRATHHVRLNDIGADIGNVVGIASKHNGLGSQPCGRDLRWNRPPYTDVSVRDPQGVHGYFLPIGPTLIENENNQTMHRADCAQTRLSRCRGRVRNPMVIKQQHMLVKPPMYIGRRPKRRIKNQAMMVPMKAIAVPPRPSL